MYEFLKTLPMWYYLIAFMIFSAAMVIISIKGKVLVMWGKRKIGIGGFSANSSKNVSKKEDTEVLLNKGTSVPKRTCGDCILIMMGEREKYELMVRKTYNKTLKNQMNFAEQKLLDIQNILDKCFYEKYNSSSNPGSYEIQYKLYYGLVSIALIKVKDEIRRSFKENGFIDMDDKEFTDYVKGKLRNIIQVLIRSVKTIYPSTNDGISIAIEDILSGISSHMPDLQEIISDMYITAKKVVIDTEDEVNAVEKDFSDWINKFIS